MRYIQKETPVMTLYQADTDETYEDISPRRGKEIYDKVVGEDAEEIAEGCADRYNWSYNNAKDKARVTYPCIRVDRDIVLRALGGILVEKEWEDDPREMYIPNGTPQYGEIRDFLLRKEVGYTRTEHILVDVEPYHPLQELAKREGQGELESGSDEWKEAYARAFDGREPYNSCEAFAEDVGIEDEVEYKEFTPKERYNLVS